MPATRHAKPLILALALVALVGVIVASPPGFVCFDAAMATADEDAPDGRWRALTTGETGERLTEEQEQEMERLRSLGYLTGSRPAPAVTGIITHDGGRAQQGLNLYTSGHFPGAVLMDMDGNVLHLWERGFLEVWPERLADSDNENARYWRHVHLFDNGDLLAIFEGYGLVKLDRASNIIWSHFGGEHHDLKVLDDGTICVLTREPSLDPRFDPDSPVMEDFVTFLTPDGVVVRNISLLEGLGHSRYAQLLARTRPRGDVLHTNAVEVLDGSIRWVHHAFRSGNILVSMRTLSALAVIDRNSELVEWALVGSWRRQHDPSVLPNGNILLFDNEGNGDGSRVIEIDPASGDIEWSYGGDPPAEFYTEMCGAATRLPNGNTLATESDAGRAIEVTPDGDIVWEYRNPERAGESGQLVATLFEVERLPSGFPTDWIRGE